MYLPAGHLVHAPWLLLWMKIPGVQGEQYPSLALAHAVLAAPLAHSVHAKQVALPGSGWYLAAAH